MVRRLLLACALAALWALPSEGAVAHGTAVTCNSGSTAGTTTMDCTNVTVASGEALICWVGANDNSADLTPVVEWDSAGVSEDLTIIAELGEAGLGRHLWVGKITNPTAGVNKTVAFSALSSAAQDSGGCVPVSGADNVGTFNDATCDTFANTSSSRTSPNGSNCNSDANECIVSFMSKGNAADPTVTAGGGTLQSVSNAASASFDTSFASDCDGGGADTIEWNHTGSVAISVITFNINAAAVGGGAPPPGARRGLMGVGR